MPRYQKSAAFNILKADNLQTTTHSKTVTDLAAATTLAAADSGKIFTLSLAGGFTVTLPTPGAAGAGWSAQFIVGVAPTTAYIIASGTASTMYGTVTTSEAALGDSGAGDDNIQFVASSAVIGDLITITSNGTNYFAYGVSTLAASIVFAT